MKYIVTRGKLKMISSNSFNKPVKVRIQRQLGYDKFLLKKNADCVDRRHTIATTHEPNKRRTILKRKSGIMIRHVYSPSLPSPRGDVGENTSTNILQCRVNSPTMQRTATQPPIEPQPPTEANAVESTSTSAPSA